MDDVEVGDEVCVFGCLVLFVVEVGWDGDYGVFDFEKGYVSMFF